jgi:mannose-6-phosphate isomerase-like protein (cupin superfamily)
VILARFAAGPWWKPKSMPTSSQSFTVKPLTDVKDSAKEFGVGDAMEVRFAAGDLDAERTGVSYHRVAPGRRQPFGHRHDEAEEIYVVIGGSGRAALDDEVVELSRLDALRVAPTVTRAFEAGPDGLEVIACGARHEGDGEIVPGFWAS